MNKGHGKPATKERPGPYDRPQVQKEIRLQELTDKMQCLSVKDPQDKHDDPEKTPEVDTAKQLNETTSSSHPVSGNWCPRHHEAGQNAGPHLKGEAMSCGCCAGTCDICSVE